MAEISFSSFLGVANATWRLVRYSLSKDKKLNALAGSGLQPEPCILYGWLRHHPHRTLLSQWITAVKPFYLLVEGFALLFYQTRGSGCKPEPANVTSRVHCAIDPINSMKREYRPAERRMSNFEENTYFIILHSLFDIRYSLPQNVKIYSWRY